MEEPAFPLAAAAFNLREALERAVATGSAITLRGHGSSISSPLSFHPRRAPDGSLSFALPQAAPRALRISQQGCVDCNGVPGGPWTRLQVQSAPGGEGLWGSKSGFWLQVVDGELSSSSEPVALQSSVCAQTAPPPVAEPPAEDGMGAGLCLQLLGSLAHLGVFNIQVSGSEVFLICEGGRLKCGPKGGVDTSGGTGQWARWVVSSLGGGAFALQSKGHGRFLVPGDVGGAGPSLSDVACPAATQVRGNLLAPCQPGVPDDVQLSAEQRQSFREQGFIVVRQAIPSAELDAALRAINSKLGSPGAFVADDEPLNANGQLKLQVPRNEFDMRRLIFESPQLWGTLNRLIGPGKIQTPQMGQGQLALRFPLPLSHKAMDDMRPDHQYHIDGMGQNRYHPFALLVGISLSDQTRPNRGNLHVFPGSHLHEGLQRYYLERIEHEDAGEDDAAKPDIGKPTQVLLARGDVVIAHQLLAHRAGQNFSPDIRYQVFYRLRHVDHENLRAQVSLNPWADLAV